MTTTLPEIYPDGYIHPPVRIQPVIEVVPPVIIPKPRVIEQKPPVIIQPDFVPNPKDIEDITRIIRCRKMYEYIVKCVHDELKPERNSGLNYTYSFPKLEFAMRCVPNYQYKFLSLLPNILQLGDPSKCMTYADYSEKM